jgi:tRNA(Ile)-lysidine synthase
VRAALGPLAPGDLVLVGLSGGPDSCALAAATAVEAPRAGLRAGAVVVDHGLQAGSEAVAEKAAGWARERGLDPVRVVPVEVGRAGGPEGAARAARHAALRAAAGSTGALAVLLGHTLDDQAETVLLGLARGSGARSLGGMAPVAGLLRRPLLGLTRAEVRAAAAAEGAPVWDDPHNDDRAARRARTRHDLLPALDAALGPGVPAALARTADLLRADADALDGWAAAAAADARRDDDPAGLDAEALAGLPAAVRTRVIRAAAVAAGCPAGALTAAHVGEVDRLVADWHGQGPIALPGQVRAARRCGRLLLLTT